MLTEQPEPGREICAVGRDHAAVARADDLTRVKTEADKRRPTVAANGLILIATAGGAGGVLDQGNPVTTGEVGECREVRGTSHLVGHEDGLGTWRDGRRRLDWVKIQGQRIDVDEPRRGAEVKYRVGGRDVAVRRDDDLVAGTDVQYVQGEVEGCGTVGDRDGVASPGGGTKLSLQFAHPGPLGDPSAAQRLGHEGDLLVADFRTHQGNGGSAHAFSQFRAVICARQPGFFA